MQLNQCASTGNQAVKLNTHSCAHTHTHFYCICQCGIQAEKMLTQCVVGGKRGNGAVGPSGEQGENTHQSY